MARLLRARESNPGQGCCMLVEAQDIHTKEKVPASARDPRLKYSEKKKENLEKQTLLFLKRRNKWHSNFLVVSVGFEPTTLKV